MIPIPVPCPVCSLVLRPNAKLNYPRHGGCKGGLTSAVEAMAVRLAEEAAAHLATAQERHAALVAKSAQVSADADRLAETYRRHHADAVASYAGRIADAEREVEQASRALALAVVRSKATP